MQPARLKLLLPLLASLFASFGCVAPVFAGIIFSVDMDLSTAGIQSTRVAAPGDIFTVGLVLTVDASGVSSYGISINFDTTELALNGAPAAATPALPGGLFSLSAPIENNALGQVYSFNGATFGSGPVSTSFTVGTINFKVVSVANDGLADVTPGFFNSGVDGLFDNAGNPVVPTFATGAVVPEPLTAALLVFGLPFSVSLWREWRRRSGRSSSR